MSIWKGHSEVSPKKRWIFQMLWAKNYCGDKYLVVEYQLKTLWYISILKYCREAKVIFQMSILLLLVNAAMKYYTQKKQNVWVTTQSVTMAGLVYAFLHIYTFPDRSSRCFHDSCKWQRLQLYTCKSKATKISDSSWLKA